MYRSHRFGALGVLVGLCLTLSPARGQEIGPSSKESGSKNLNQAIKELINRGAKIFNENGDYAGCYRMWEGALIVLRPSLSEEMQKQIDAGLASAGRMPSYADKAFELRKVLDAIRGAEAGSKIAEKGDPATDKIKGTVSGVVTFAGKPATDATVHFHSVMNKQEFVSAVKDGRFSISGLLPGKYQISISGDRVPGFLDDPKKSGLALQVAPGKQTFDLNLGDLKSGKNTKDPMKEKLGDPKKTKIDDAKKVSKEAKKGSTSDVFGKITVNGRPLTDGTITFTTEDGTAKYTGKIEKNGTYKLGNVDAGNYKIVIEPAKKEMELLDMRFQNAKTTGVRFEVRPGPNEYNLDLPGRKE